MVEAILERRPSLQGLRTVQSKTTLEVGELSFLQRTQVFYFSSQGVGSLGKAQHSGAQFTAIGKKYGEP